MKAARFYGARDIRIDDVQQPGSPGPGEVLIRPASIGICGSDLHEYTHGPILIPTAESPHPLSGATMPLIMGHEFSGVVAEVGAGVTGLAPDDRVAVMPQTACGRCGPCLRGDKHLCRIVACIGMHTTWGGLAELAIVPGDQLTKLPEELSLDQGALIEPAAVAVNALDGSRLRGGEDLLITGCGPIGALTILAALAMGAGRVFVLEPNPKRAAWAKKLGATQTWEDPAELRHELFDVTDGVGVDAAVECSGSQGGLATCATMVRPTGTIVVIGLHTKSATLDPNVWILKDLTLQALVAYPVLAWRRVSRLLASGRFPAEKVVTRRIPLENVVDGFEALIDPSGDEMKILISQA